MTSFWKGILSSKDTNSSKRLVTLIIAAHFILASFAILIVALYTMFYLPKGKVDPLILNMLQDIIEKDFYIILAGLGFITIERAGDIYLEKAKSVARAKIVTGVPDADTINVDTVNIKPPVKEEGEGGKESSPRQ